MSTLILKEEEGGAISFYKYILVCLKLSADNNNFHVIISHNTYSRVNEH